MFSPSSSKILHCLYNWYDEYVLFNMQCIYLKDFISKVDIGYQKGSLSHVFGGSIC